MRDPGGEETCESASGFGLHLGKLEAVMWILFYVFIFVLVSMKTMFFGIFTHIYYYGLFIGLAFQKVTQRDWEDGSVGKTLATQTRGPQFSVPAHMQKLVMCMPRLLALRW